MLSRQRGSRCIYMATDKDAGQKIERVILTFEEAQEFLRVSHQTVYNLMRQGLPSHKVGKKRMFLKDELLQWVKEH